MQFAINYSDAAAALFDSGAIVLDFFKTPDWPDLIARASKHRAVRVHFGINVGADDSQTRDFAEADRLAKQTGTRFVNCHLAPRARDFPGDDSRRRVIDRMIADVRRITDYFGVERVIAENIPLGNPDENFHPACCEPGAIAEVLEATGVGFLLDLSHARMTARYLGLDEREYISALPVKKIREMHLTGLQIHEGRLRDHLDFGEEDWTQAQWAFDRIAGGDWSAPDLVALEYGGVGEKFAWRTRSDVIATHVPRLMEMMCASDGARVG